MGQGYLRMQLSFLIDLVFSMVLAITEPAHVQKAHRLIQLITSLGIKQSFGEASLLSQLSATVRPEYEYFGKRRGGLLDLHLDQS